MSPPFDELVAIGRVASGSGAEPVLLSDRGDRLVVRVGDVVVKAHAPDVDPGELAARVRLAGAAALDRILLPPRSGPLRVDGRLVTVWPVATVVDPAADLEGAPWADGARLLARLHAVAAPDRTPPTTGPAGVARAVARLDRVRHPAAAVVRRAARALPPWARAERPSGSTLVHGDWHLGQLAHLDGGWCLIDVDDLGLGDPAWDLARPAALFAVGLLPPAVWGLFLDAYRAAGGPGVPGGGDPWPRLDVPARALAVRLAAQVVAAADSADRRLDDADEALVDACMRMAP